MKDLNPAEEEDEDQDEDHQVEFGTLAEQKDEAFYDDRSDADDDMEKGRIKFPKDKLYGRDHELHQLQQIWKQLLSSDDTTSQVVFLGGYSGTGKSALVQDFCSSQYNTKKATTTTTTQSLYYYLTGKFSQTQSGVPFSALTHALDAHVLYLIQQQQHSSHNDWIETLLKRLEKVELTLGSYDACILRDTLIPSLDGLLQLKLQPNEPNAAAAKGDATTAPTSTTAMPDFNMITHVLIQYFKALAARKQPPITLFMDDLQWADDASLQLLTALLQDKSLSNIIFIGAYRINEIHPEHAFTKLMTAVEDARKNWTCGETVTRMEISNLSPDSIADFIADSLDLKVTEVAPISQAVYSKTLGNIFFVQQALEELARKNAIYYDVICFSWQFGNISRVELEQFLSSDVVQMVQAKLQTLDQTLQTALSVAAWYTTDTTMEISLLAEMLQALPSPSSSSSSKPAAGDGKNSGTTTALTKVTVAELSTLLRQAYNEGLVLEVATHTSKGSKKDTLKSYKFAHDKIREASCALVPEGDARHQLLLSISNVLEQRHAMALSKQHDWMVFSAARHLNSLPLDMTGALRMAELNFKVGKISISKGAFSEAVQFLRTGHEQLLTLTVPPPNNTLWTDHYKLTLDLKTNLAETEHYLGREERAIELTEEIFQNARSLPEKSRAHFVRIEAMSKSSANYDSSIAKGIEILQLYGMKVPLNPTEAQVKREKFRLFLALRGRSLLCLSKFPISTDEIVSARSRVAVMTLTYANYGKKPLLATMVGHKVLREGLTHKYITKDFPVILIMLGSPLREQEKYDSAFAFANAGISVMDRFSHEKGLEMTKAKMALYGSLSCLRVSFREAIDTYLELNKALLAKGEIQMALGAGMLAMVAFMNASLPLNALFEPKLMLLEEESANLGRKTFVVIFSMIRQCLYNLQGGPKASSSPVKLDGAAFKEDVCHASFEGPPQKMNLRDMSTMRLMLSVIFNDEAVMQEMLERLDEFPVYDMSVVRQHLRMTYTGFAAHILRNKYGTNKKWAKITFDFLKKLAKFGSPNATPAFACLKALDKPSLPLFNEAIQVCGNAGLFNLTAIMNERCALWLLEQKNNVKGGNNLYEEYLKCALWFYHDWGAMEKVAQLKQRFEFLRAAMQEKAPSQLSEMRRQAARMGVPHTVQLSETNSSAMFD